MRKLSRFRPLRGRLVGVFDTPLQSGTGAPSKNDSVFVPFGAACGAYAIRPYDRVRVALQKMILFSSPSGPLVGRIQYAPTTGYVRFFEIPMQFSNRVRAALQKMIPSLSPSGPLVGRMRYAPTTGYVRSFEIPMRFPNRVRAALQKTIPFSSPSGPSVGRMQYAPTIGYVRSFEIPMQFSNWVCARVQKMDLYTPPSVAYGGAYAIRPYNRVRTILRNIDAIPQLGTGGPSKNSLVSVPLGTAGWGVCDTPLRPGMCDLSKY